MEANIEYNIKKLRKAIRGIIKGYKRGMFGKYSCTDAGGGKWSIEYVVLFWREDWKDFDYYSASNKQSDIFKDIEYWKKESPENLLNFTKQLTVSVALMCDGRENEKSIIKLNGELWENTD